jgi:hypothetical protein
VASTRWWIQSSRAQRGARSAATAHRWWRARDDDLSVALDDHRGELVDLHGGERATACVERLLDQGRAAMIAGPYQCAAIAAPTSQCGTNT